MKVTTATAATVLAVGVLVASVTAVAAQSGSEPSPEPEVAASVAPSPLTESSLAPPEAEGVAWDDQELSLGTQIAETADEQTRSEWDSLLAATGGSYGSSSQLNAYATDPETGDIIGTYSAIRIVGAETDALRDGLVDLLAQVDETGEFLFEASEIGGRDVTVVFDLPESLAILVVIEDTAYALILPPELMAAVVEALP